MAKIFSQAALVLPMVVIAGIQAASASELVHYPRNPSFGGSPLYSSHLLGIAGAINKYKDPDQNTGALASDDPSMEFERIIRSSLLSRISSEIANQICGENAVDAGKFVIGNTVVDFFQEGGQTVVNLRDNATGGTTRIEIPRPQF